MIGVPLNPTVLWDEHNQQDRQFNQPNQYGYDVRAIRGNKDINHLNKRANGQIAYNQFYFPIFVQEIEMGVGLSGTTAQSRFTRDFYPHNFVQPKITISGICPDQGNFGLLCNFIHHCQRSMLGTTLNQGLVQLSTVKRGLFGWHTYNQLKHLNRTNVRGVTTHVNTPGLGLTDKQLLNQNLRGESQAIIVQGYVASMPQEYIAGNYCPIYTFDFVIKQMLLGPFEEGASQGSASVNWTTMLRATQIQESSSKSNIKTVKQNYKYALANAANIINTQG